MGAQRFGLWTGLGVWLASGLAAAQTRPGVVSLRWSAPDECPDDTLMVHEVEALLGRSLTDSNEQSLAVRGSVQGSASLGYSAKLSFSGPQGNDERSLQHPDCEKLAQAVALIIALAIDPERVRATQRTRDAQDAGPEASARAAIDEAPTAVTPAPVSAPPAAPANGEARTVEREVRASEREGPARRPSPSEPVRGIRFAIHGVAGAGPLPDLGAGLEAAIGWHHRSFEADVLGRYWVPRTSAVNVAPSASVELGLATLGLRGCWLSLAGAWAFSACLGADLGDLRASGVGVQNPRAPHATYAAAVGAVQVRYARHRLQPEGGFELSGALARPRFGVTDNGQPTQTFRPAAWGFSVFLGFAFEL